MERNETTFSKGEIAAIKNETEVVQRPSRNLQTEIEKINKKVKQGQPQISLEGKQDARGFLHLGSPAAAELDKRRLENGYQLLDSASVASTLEEFEGLLHDHKSPIVSNFTHLMNYRNGHDFMSFEDFARNRGETVDLLGEYTTHAEQMEKQIGKVDQIIAGLHDIQRKIVEEGSRL